MAASISDHGRQQEKASVIKVGCQVFEEFRCAAKRCMSIRGAFEKLQYQEQQLHSALRRTQ